MNVEAIQQHAREAYELNALNGEAMDQRPGPLTAFENFNRWLDGMRLRPALAVEVLNAAECKIWLDTWAECEKFEREQED